MHPIDSNILSFLAERPGFGRSTIRKHVAPTASSQTIWRALVRLTEQGLIESDGVGRAKIYRLAGVALVRSHLTEPHSRRKRVLYQSSFVERYQPNKSFYLTEADRTLLYSAGRAATPVHEEFYPKGLVERLLIDLSWASSRMEGNTYDLLETERLIRHGQEAVGKDHRESLMILNHKEAIHYLLSHMADLSICRYDLFNLHAILSQGLLIDPAMAGRIRSMPVGISYSAYLPPEEQGIIDTSFNVLIEKANAIGDPFEQAFFLVVQLPYLQPFADVNKRTSRLAANIPLLKAKLAPMSFLSIDDRAYIDGLIGVYELNNIALLKQVFIDGYTQSADRFRFISVESVELEREKLAYRELVKTAVQRCVRQWKSVRPLELREMVVIAGVPPTDVDTVLALIAEATQGLHPGNAIAYGLRADDLTGFHNRTDV